MSRVFDVSCGIRASTSPTLTCWPSLTVMIEPSWNVMLTESSEPGELDLVAVVVEQLDLRPHALRRRARAALRIDDDQRRQAGDFVDLLRDGDAFLDVLELHAARRTR